MKNKLLTPRWIAFFLLALSVLCMQAWIFGNSMQTASVSSDRSDKVVEAVRPIVEPVLDAVHVPPSDSLLSHLIRKTAHFAEFGLLGVLVASALLCLPTEKRWLRALAFPYCVLSAFADEGLQLLYEGRSAQLSDVLLDSCGALLGILLAVGVFLPIRLLRQRKNGNH